MCTSTRNIINRFLQASNNGISYDCKFIVGSEKVVVEGHKFLFSVTSEVFQAMFYGELKEDNAVKIEDLNVDGFVAMRFFIYTGEVIFTSLIHALATFVAARKYLIPELTKKCIEYIQKMIKPSEVLECYEYCETNNIAEFEELCLKTIEERTVEVVASKYFLTAKIETIQLILKSSSLKLKSEIDVFHLFEKWALAEAAREQISEGELACHFENLKRYIRFLTISLEEIGFIKQSLLLTQAEKNAIEWNLLEMHSAPMPETLSKVKQQRSFLSILPNFEKYKYVHTFLVSVDKFCGSCSQIDLNCDGVYLNLRSTVENSKYLCLTVRPLQLGLFNMKIKITFLGKQGNDLSYEKECQILEKKSPGHDVLIFAIPLNKIDYRFYSRGTANKVLTFDVRFDVVEIKIYG